VESGRVHTAFEPAVLVATLALLPVLIVEADAKSEGWQTAANWIIWSVFVVELCGIAFLSLLTAIASRFVKEERGSEHDEVMETLRRIEAEVADLRAQVGSGTAK
jgi:hypothetical protein